MDLVPSATVAVTVKAPFPRSLVLSPWLTVPPASATAQTWYRSGDRSDGMVTASVVLHEAPGPIEGTLTLPSNRSLLGGEPDGRFQKLVHPLEFPFIDLSPGPLGPGNAGARVEHGHPVPGGKDDGTRHIAEKEEIW